MNLSCFLHADWKLWKANTCWMLTIFLYAVDVTVACANKPISFLRRDVLNHANAGVLKLWNGNSPNLYEMLPIQMIKAVLDKPYGHPELAPAVFRLFDQHRNSGGGLAALGEAVNPNSADKHAEQPARGRDDSWKQIAHQVAGGFVGILVGVILIFAWYAPQIWQVEPNEEADRQS
jgi:hypothetical protein